MKRSFSNITVLALMVVLLSYMLANHTVMSAQDATPTLNAPQAITVVTMNGTRSSKGNSSIRLVNASPVVPSISVTLNGQAAVSDLNYGVSTDFMDYPAGTYTVDVTTPEGSGILSKEVVLAPEVSSTLILTGLTNGTSENGLDLSIFLTERSPTRGKARLEAINAVPDVPAVDLVSDQPLLTEIGFGKIGDAALNLDAGTYNLQFISSDAKASVLDLASTQLQADTIYTIIVIGQQLNGSVEPLVLTTTSPVPQPAAPTTGAPAPTFTPLSTLSATSTVSPILTQTAITEVTAEATTEATSEATVETTVEATVEITSEPTTEVTPESTLEQPIEPTAEITVSP